MFRAIVVSFRRSPPQPSELSTTTATAAATTATLGLQRVGRRRPGQRRRRRHQADRAERHRGRGAVVVETVPARGDGQTGRLQQRADEPAGQRLRRECRLRVFHVAQVKKRRGSRGRVRRVPTASFAFLRTAAAAQRDGKVIACIVRTCACALTCYNIILS